MASTGLRVQAHLRFPDREAEGPGRNFCSLIPEGNGSAGVQTWSDRSKVCVPLQRWTSGWGRQVAALSLRHKVSVYLWLFMHLPHLLC